MKPKPNQTLSLCTFPKMSFEHERQHWAYRGSAADSGQQVACNRHRTWLFRHTRNIEARTVYRHVHKVGPSVASGAHTIQQWARKLGGVEESGDNFVSAFPRLVPRQTWSLRPAKMVAQSEFLLLWHTFRGGDVA